MNTVRIIALGAQIILFRMGLLALNGYATFTIVWGICMMCFSATIAILLLFDFFGKKRNPIKYKFTMIELVAVVAIVGILASFVVNISKTDKHKAVISQIGGYLNIAKSNSMKRHKPIVVKIYGQTLTLTLINDDLTETVIESARLIQEVASTEVKFLKEGDLEDKSKELRIESGNWFLRVNQFTGKISYYDPIIKPNTI